MFDIENESDVSMSDVNESDIESESSGSVSLSPEQIGKMCETSESEYESETSESDGEYESE